MAKVVVITPEIEAAARRLAEVSGTTPTEAVAEALRAKLQMVPKVTPGASLAEIDEVLRQIHTLPVDRAMTDDEILGYDGDGIPEQPYLGR